MIKKVIYFSVGVVVASVWWATLAIPCHDPNGDWAFLRLVLPIASLLLLAALKWKE